MRTRLVLSTLVVLQACTRPEPPESASRAGASAPPAAATAPADPLPPASDRAAWLARARWTDRCEADHREMGGPEPGVRLHPLGPGRHLVHVVCFTAAYQEALNFVVYDTRTVPARSTLVRFPLHDGQRWTVSPDVAGLPAFDPKSRELEVFSKARGIGDCGTLARFAFPERGPELLWVRARSCDAEAPDGTVPPPEEWPRVPPDSLPR